MSERPRLCARCGKLMGVGRVCPYCGADAAALGTRLRRLVAPPGDDGAWSVTTAVIVVNVFLFATALLVGGTAGSGGFDFLTPDHEVLFRLGLQDNAAIAAGQWWRLVLMVFLHLGVLHVAFNCYILYFAGRLLEAELGGRLLFLLYMAGGLAGSLASYVAGIGGAGASGAVFGLLGAILVRRRLVDGDFRHPLTQQIIFLIGLNVVFGLAMASRINNVAHGAGFVAGCAGAWALTSLRLGRKGAAALMVATAGTFAVTLAAFVLMVLSLFRGGPHEAMAANTCWQQVGDAVESGYDPEAARRALACLPDLPRLEAPANDAAEAALAGLRAAAAARDEGDAAGQDRAVASARAAYTAYAAWLQDAAPRYGLRFR